MKKQGTSIENVQKGFNAFTAVVEKVKGMFSAAFNNFMDGFGAGAGEMADFAQGIANAFQPLMASIFGLDTGMGSTSEGMKNLGYNVAKGLTDKIKAFALFLAESIEYARGYFKQLEGDSIGATGATGATGASGTAKYATGSTGPDAPPATVEAPHSALVDFVGSLHVPLS